jgi:hypothetical protein
MVVVGSDKSNIQRLLSLGVWGLFFMLLLPVAGFDVDILYTFTFFGLIFFIIYKFSYQVNELFISEQFRLIQLVLQKRVASYWLLKLGNSWGVDRTVLVGNILKELTFCCGIIEAQLNGIDQIVKNSVAFIQHHKLLVAHLVNLRTVWARISYGATSNQCRLYRPVFLYSKRSLVIHFLISVVGTNIH